MIPLFLIAMYGISIYVFSKSEYNLGGGLFFISFVFFIMSIILQIFTTFKQIFIFIFFVGMLVGIVLYFLER
jgi:predicted membrane channel-forming protein YqfA (hemolysin III family)